MSEPPPHAKRPTRSAENTGWGPARGERVPEPNAPIPGPERGVRAGGWPHRAVHRFTGRQRGLVTRSQLRSVAVSSSSIGHALSSGLLIPMHRGVYSLVPVEALPSLAREHGALLACGGKAVLSHASAAGLWGWRLLPDDRVELTLIGGDAGRGRAGLVVHRARSIDRADLRGFHGLPVTAPARTFLDVAPGLNERDLERGFDEALARRVMRLSEVQAMLERHPGRPGVARLRALVGDDRARTMTRSEAEERFFALTRRAELPRPAVNARLHGFEVDFLWHHERVVVEIDGMAYHKLTRGARARSRTRRAATGGGVPRAALHLAPDLRSARVGRRPAGGCADQPPRRSLTRGREARRSRRRVVAAPMSSVGLWARA